MDSNTVKEAATKREQKAPEMAKQVRNRSRRKADGDIHAVDRTVSVSRKQEAAEVNDVVRPPVKRWGKASALPGMPDLPGYHVEYVRRDNQTRGDHENLFAHIQEGWEPCRKSDFPRSVLPTQRLSELGECIGNASSILMKIPNELKAQRDEYYQSRRNEATAAVDRPDPTLGGVVTGLMPLVEDVNKLTMTAQRMRARRAPVKVAADV